MFALWIVKRDLMNGHSHGHTHEEIDAACLQAHRASMHQQPDRISGFKRPFDDAVNDEFWDLPPEQDVYIQVDEFPENVN